MKELAYACGRFRIFCNHVEIASTSCTGQLVAEAQVVDAPGDGIDLRRVGSSVNGHFLIPCGAHKFAESVEVAAHYCVIHFHCVSFHAAEQTQLRAFVEEHVADYHGKNVLCRAGYACVVQKMA